MKDLSINLKVCMLAALVAGFSGAALADDRQAALDAQAQAAAELAAVSNNRTGTIDGIVSIWEPQAADMGFEVDAWKAEFTTMLEGATDQQLLDIQGATSYDGVRAILQGRDAPVSLEGVVSTAAMGDISADLLFTPVVPCRIFDTRFDVYGGPGGGNPGTVLNYYVYGSNALLAPQGHTAGTGCPAPQGEPVAIAANFTVVPYGKGHIRAWPYGAPQPNASFLNYSAAADANLANAGIVATCYGCARDLSVSTWFGSSDSLADVMGYFYPAADGHDSFSTSGPVHFGFPATDFQWRFIGPTITRTVNGGDQIYMNANQAVGTTTTASGLDIAPCYRNTTGSTLSYPGGAIYGLSSSAGNRVPANINGVYNLSPGTYELGMCYRTSSSGWNSNEYGYLSILHINKYQ